MTALYYLLNYKETVLYTNEVHGTFLELHSLNFFLVFTILYGKTHIYGKSQWVHSELQVILKFAPKTVLTHLSQYLQEVKEKI